MKRIALLTAFVVLVGAGVALAAPSGLSRIVLAKGTMEDLNIERSGTVEVSHRVTTWEPDGTTGWASWPGDLVVTMNKGELEFLMADGDGCVEKAFKVGDSFVIPAGAVYRGTNTGEGVAEVHWVAFLPPGASIQEETKPAGCPA